MHTNDNKYRYQDRQNSVIINIASSQAYKNQEIFSNTQLGSKDPRSVAHEPYLGNCDFQHKQQPEYLASLNHVQRFMFSNFYQKHKFGTHESIAI